LFVCILIVFRLKEPEFQIGSAYLCELNGNLRKKKSKNSKPKKKSKFKKYFRSQNFETSCIFRQNVFEIVYVFLLKVFFF